MCGDAAPFVVRWFDDIDSTQRYLLEEARRGASAGLVAVAAYQSAGRGRLGRRWEAPPGSNLLMSVLLRPAMPVDELHLCTVAVALAAQEACAFSVGLETELKWPNDLMVAERKLAGVLAEAVAGAPPGPRVTAVVVGLGLNVQWPPPDPARRAGPTPGPEASDPDAADPEAADPEATDPDEIARFATSIWRETGSRVEPEVLLNSVLSDLGPRLRTLDHEDGRRRLSEEYRQRCATLGRRVRVSTATETVTGVASGLTDEGHLVVEVDGGPRTIAAGDVVHLRDVD